MPAEHIKKLCVYCASSSTIDQVYFDHTKHLAKLLVADGYELVYGGGAKGLMGALADSVIENKGKIKGIMPRFLNEIEWAHRLVSDMEFTDSMHERKARFLEEVDGLIALAGGSGTLEELLEAITLKRLGLFEGPIVILNSQGYYDPLKQMLDDSVSKGFMRADHQSLWTFVNEPEEVITALKTD